MHDTTDSHRLKTLMLWTAMVLTCLATVRADRPPRRSSGFAVDSPDGNVVLTFDVKEVAGRPGCPVYSVSYRGRTVIAQSRLGLELEDGPLRDGLQMGKGSISHNDVTWKPVYGERSTIRDRYKQVDMQFYQEQPPHRSLNLTFRVYSEGAAFRYAIARQQATNHVAIIKENTEFCFEGDHTAWAAYSAQGSYEKTTISQIKPGCERPLTICVADDVYLALAEARLVDYARMKFGPLSARANSLVSELSGGVSAELPLTTPWRVVMVADSPGRLLENNDIILNLNEPCAIAETSWIRPGKVIREVTLTTIGGKACVDFAVEHNLQYVEFDAGWYGAENDDKSDASTVTVDPKRSRGPLDLQAAIRYASEREIGILVYVNRKALESQLDKILPLYEKWGIKGVKYGFVNVGSQKWTTWLHEAVRNAAEHRLMVDIHDEYRPTGYSRTYPNLMTQEGIRGDEERQTNSMALTTLFTRMLAGAGDNTICYFDQRVDRNSSHAYQLAKAVCFYSPWQFLYWYDRPAAAPRRAGGAGGSRNIITDEPELEFFDHVPTVWDDTKVIHGSIGEYAVIARRSGEDWFIGCMNANEARELSVPLGFLEKSKAYVAHIYRDDPAVQTRTHVAIDRLLVDSGTVVKAAMTAKGGQAMRIVPATSEDIARFPRYATGKR